MRHATEEKVASLASALPKGVVRHDKPLCNHDYVIADPMDQAALDRLLFAIVCDVRKEMVPEGKLYIVLGENHSNPAHIMAQAGLMENIVLMEQDKDTMSNPIIFCHETPYNELDDYIHSCVDLDIDELELGDDLGLYRYDTLGHVFTKVALFENLSPTAPEARNRLMASILEHRVSACLIDAARQDFFYLDGRDGLATEFALAHYGVNPERESVGIDIDGSGVGIGIRNAVMARRSKNKMQKMGSDFALLAVGSGHVFGAEAYGMSFDMSLTSCLKREILSQDRILSIFFSLESYGPEAIAENALPDEAFVDDFGHIPVIIRGLSERCFDWVDSGEQAFIESLGKSYTPENIPNRFFMPSKPDRQSVLEEIRALALK